MMSLFELRFFDYEDRLEMNSWEKAERLFNCDDFFDLFRKKKLSKKMR